MIEVALASNRSYFVGLIVTLASLLRSNKHNRFHIHIIDGGLSRRQRVFILREVNGHNRLNGVTFHQIENGTFRGFKPDYGKSYMAYARMLLSSLVSAERVVYIDSDLLIATDIRPLWELSLEGYVVAAVQDAGIKWLKNDNPFDGPCDDAQYFNSGVLVMNLSAWRRLGLQEKLFQIIAKAPERFRWWDQTAMNALFRGQVLFIEGCWNCIADSVELATPPIPVIFHYVGEKKPWSKYLESTDYLLWREFHARFVRPRIWLCLAPEFLLSWLRHVRHRLIAQSVVLRRLVCFVVRLNGIRSGRRVSRDEIESRYASATATRERAYSRSIVDTYIKAQWGEPAQRIGCHAPTASLN